MAENEKPLILITNDDGITSAGIRYLVDSVAGMGDIMVVAPDGPRSGGSASITCETILRPKQCEDYNGARMTALNGTPVDCVKLALNALVPRRPSLVLSGINHGANTGNSIVYSGTMGATLEACMQGVPAIGYSLVSHTPRPEDFEACLPFMRELTGKVLREGLPEGVCLNVNMPSGGIIKGMKRARACKGRWTEEYAPYKDPFGRMFYMLTGTYVNSEPFSTDTDLYWLSQGYISIVPSVPDRDFSGPLDLLAPFE